jgi:hypothetical protein
MPSRTITTLAILFAAACIAPALSRPVLEVLPGTSAEADRLALQAALDSLKALGGGNLRLAPGVYRVDRVPDAALCDSCRRITLEGAGDATVLRAEPGADGADDFLFFRNSSDINVRKLRFEGLRLPKEAWGTNQEYHAALRFGDCRRVRVERCAFLGFFTGAAVFQSSRGITVSDCAFDSVANRLKGDYGAIALEAGSGKALLTRNVFTHLTHSAISAYGADSVDILSNRAGFDPSSEFTMGIFAPAGLVDSRIARNRIAGPRNEGVVLASGTLAVTGNRIERNVIQARFAGVSLNESRYGCDQVPAGGNLIYGNAIAGIGEDSVEHGILLNRAGRTRIAGNEFRRSRRAVSEQNCSSGTESSGNRIR